MDACSRKHKDTMKDLTTRQKEILNYIEYCERKNGFWPSIREIQLRFDFKSTNAVMGHLRALEKKNAIKRIAGQARTFYINRRGRGDPAAFGGQSDAPAYPENADSVVDIPIAGDVAAGYPDRVEPAGEIGRLQVDASTVGRAGRQTFALEVRGESMVDADINEGDKVIVEQREPRDGDIVAALIDGETTLKRFIKKPGDPPYLKAENTAYPELHPVNELTIQGVAKAVVRPL